MFVIRATKLILDHNAMIGFIGSTSENVGSK
jgi:hypothetical protein